MSSEQWFYTNEVSNRITSVEVERHTATSVWIEGRRHARESTWEFYSPTWKEAHEHMLEVAQGRVDDARRALERAKSTYGNVKGMKEPSHEQ